jgi:hypothetical protein
MRMKIMFVVRMVVRSIQRVLWVTLPMHKLYGLPTR